MRNIRVLVAEDDPDILRGLVDVLESEGYGVKAARDGAEALKAFGKGRFDLIILDIMMPAISGYDVCREIRRTDGQTPIIMLTAKSQEVDKVVGLELGADDYVTKPFGVRELLARVAAVCRRAKRSTLGQNELPVAEKFGEARIDRKRFVATRGRKSFSLSARELKLIDVFSAHPEEVLARDSLLNEVWGMEYMGTTRTLDQHIAQLRKKVGAGTIVTVHGIGYRYRPSNP